MSRKDIIIMSVLINAGIIIILLVSSLTTKESYFVASSAKIAESILESNENGMTPDLIIDKKIELDNVAVVKDKPEEQSFVKLEESEDIIHKLPTISLSESVYVKESDKCKIKENRFTEVTVKKGDTLEKIAKTNNTSLSNVIKINELSNTFLRIGQTILVPKLDLAKKNTRNKNIDFGIDYYTVRAGDNPWTIAMKHHLKVDDLLKLNNLNSITAKKLRPGDKLKIK